jgi:glycosyltransferase involved in cell wall biosynthesis
MRILLSVFSCGPDLGSEPGVGWHWAVELGRLGHEVVALTSTRYRPAIETAATRGELPPGLRFEFFMPEWLTRARDLGCRLGFTSLTEHVVHLVWQVIAFRFASSHFPAGQFDCVHHLTYGGIRHPTLMGGLPYPLVLGPLGGGERAPLALRRSLPWGGWLKDLVRDLHTWLIRFDPITRRACEQALVVYVKTKESGHALPRRFHPKIAIEMEIGIAPVEAQTRPERAPDTPLRLLYAGRFLYWKGMHLGLRALAEARARGELAEITMLGRGPGEASWRALARELGVEAAVTWLNWVAHAHMAELYRAHDVLLFPSLHDSSGNAVLEALAQGLPVICFDLGGPGTIVDSTCGRVVATAGRSEAECVAGLARAIEELRRSPALCRELGLGARARAQEYHWPKQVVRVYGDVQRRLEQQSVAERPVRVGAGRARA